MSNGNVGIGTSSPQSRLSIEGTCIDTGIGCADIAELYPSTEPVEPGDILATDLSHPGSLKKATFTDVIIGIVSSNPAIMIEGSRLQLMTGSYYQSSPRKPAVALSGRVPVKVNNENGSLSVGDRITPSSVPGVGRKAHPGDPTVGIALEPFDEAQSSGKILVFANLGYSKLDETSTNAPTTNGWSVSQSSGKVNVGFFGDINLNGNNILDVGKIAGMFGTWSIDADGNLAVKSVTAEEVTAGKLKVGSQPKPSGITLYDESTGDPYCLKINNGAILSMAGECSSPAGGAQSSPQATSDTGQATPIPSADGGATGQATTTTDTNTASSTPSDTTTAATTPEISSTSSSDTATSTSP